MVVHNKKNTGILFIGDIDYPEVNVIKQMITFIRKSRPLDAVLLPSFGGVKDGHGLPKGAPPTLLSSSVEQLAMDIKKMGIMVGALPHPVPAAWSDFEFVRLPMIQTRGRSH